MDSQGWTSSNHEKSLLLYEAALAKGYEAEHESVGEGLYFVEVFSISQAIVLFRCHMSMA